MDADLLPLALSLKLIAALAVCFAALVGSAWFLKKRWPGLAKLGASSKKQSSLEVIETRGLAPGSSLHLLEVEGTRILVLQTKDRGDVLWTRDASEAAPDGEAVPAFSAAYDALGRPPQRPAFGPEASVDEEEGIPAPSPQGGNLAQEDPAALTLIQELRARAAAAPAERVTAPKSAPRLAAAKADDGAQRRERELELQRERQRRYRERLRLPARLAPAYAKAGRAR